MKNNTSDWIEREHNALFRTYKRLPIVVDRAEGCKIYDRSGAAYLDFLGGIAVNTLGHGHPRINRAVQEQLQKYTHLSNYFYQEPQIRLAEMLLDATGLAKVFFSNSGGESLEGALKLARRWGSYREKSQIVAFSGGFHGRTYGALSIMDKPKYKERMGPFLPDTKIAQFNNVASIRSHIDQSTCAVVLEFLQGEGGIVPAERECIAAIEELRAHYGFLLIADEIQTGVGRTGTFCACQGYGVTPDIILLAKGIGGGLPLGVIVGGERVVDVWETGMHGTTFGGNALSCAAGIVVLEELINGVQENARNAGNYLQAELLEVCRDFPTLATGVRGKGCMVGVQLSVPAAPLVESMLRHGALANATADTVIRLLPPLTVTHEDIDACIRALRASLKEL